MVILHRVNITLEAWEDSLEYLQKLIAHVRETYGKSLGNILMHPEGLSQIPITNKQWADWIGYEHDECTVWFKYYVSKSFNARWVRRLHSSKSVIQLARSVVWNAALYIHIFDKPIAPDSTLKAIKQEMRFSNCPDLLRDAVISAINTLCHLILATISSNDGIINRVAIEYLKGEIDSTHLGRKTCINKKLRRNICNKLIINGIATLSSRVDQEQMIMETLKKENNLKASAIRSIERMLMSDEKFIRANDGLSILLPYTDEEISKINGNNREKSQRMHVLNRVEIIKDKMLRGMALTGAERVFKSKHKNLF